MKNEILVYIDGVDGPVPVGRLWARSRRGKETASFEYDQAWLRSRGRFALDPHLPLGSGPYQVPDGQSLFGVFADTAPDRWGRNLMLRAERHRAERANQAPRTLLEIDYLLQVDDEARMGALRFARSPGGPFLAERETHRIPPLVELPRLLSAADHVADHTDSEDELRLLLAPGTSLGGARPKASIRDRDGHLAIAKFPNKPGRNDPDIDIVRWEAVALQLAGNAGIETPEWRLESVGDRPVLILRRFDRDNGARVPFMSAMTVLGLTDGQTGSYPEMVDELRREGAQPHADMHELWRRIVFSVLINNTDDHLRNHGFLRATDRGWRLAPAFDLNPNPTDVKQRVLSTALDTDGNTAASLEVALSVAPYFELDREQAFAVASEVGRAVSGWDKAARRFGIGSDQIQRMRSAFDHADLRAACELTGGEPSEGPRP